MAIREREGLSRLEMFILVVQVMLAVLAGVARVRDVNTINYLEHRLVHRQARITELEGRLATARSRIAEIEKFPTIAGTPEEIVVTSGWNAVVTIGSTAQPIDEPAGDTQFGGRIMGTLRNVAASYGIDKEDRCLSPKLVPIDARPQPPVDSSRDGIPAARCFPTLIGSGKCVAAAGCGETTYYDFAGDVVDKEKCSRSL
jgi:hypothetical protein